MMNLQYISDSDGKTTGVYIPIEEWNALKSKYQGIEQESGTIPEWHKEETKQRLQDFKANPDQALDFNQAMNDIEKSL